MSDPFNERARPLVRRRMTLLGARFEFQSDSARLLSLVNQAYARLPPHRLDRNPPLIRISLRLRTARKLDAAREPPQLQTQGGAGLLCGTVDADNFAALNPDDRSGLVAVSRGMLRFPYHARYELLEFAVFTLASRVQGLVPLHGACVGSKGRGLLLVGESGAGKSTLMLQCMLQGLDVLAEDAVFVEPRRMLATGVGNFLHLRRDSLRFVTQRDILRRIRRAPVIRRRSGVEKFEVDLRHPAFRIAGTPLEVAGLVFVSGKAARGPGVLLPVDKGRALARLAASQVYAAGLPSWTAFAQRLSRVGAFELRRGKDPADAARALRGLIAWGQKTR